MAVTATVLFDRPQIEIASTILDCMARCSSASIVTGFATPGGLEAISEPVGLRPALLNALIIGAANYRAFEALDDLISAGVPVNRLFVHLGHSASTGWPNKPFRKFHPMLHSKVYYFEFPDSTAAAFVGSHNLTHFALEGLNGEASIRLDGLRSDTEFEQIRRHIAIAQSQAVAYAPAMKEAYAWWFREYFDGLKAEAGLPADWQTFRTILIFAEEITGQRPKAGEHLYFEIPAGIEQVTALQAEVHLFLFSALPATSDEALAKASSAVARYKARIEGAENRQGNREVVANWQVDLVPKPRLSRVTSGVLRPAPRGRMQQVRAEFEGTTIESYDYRFERERLDWEPVLSPSEAVSATRKPTDLPVPMGAQTALLPLTERHGEPSKPRRASDRQDAERAVDAWSLVSELRSRSGPAFEKDRASLDLARPESGAFILVSVQRRKRKRHTSSEQDRQ